MCKIYLDTSAIITALDKKDKYHYDAIFFFSTSQINEIFLYFSNLTKEELDKNKYKYLESKLESLLKKNLLNFKYINYKDNKKLHQEIINLAMLYEKPAPNYKSKKIRNDALHAAIASIAQIPLIISTNFKDLVNNNITNAIHQGNIKGGYNQFTQIMDFREYNLNFNKNDFSTITKEEFSLERFNTKDNKAKRKIKLSKKMINAAENYYMDSNYYLAILKFIEALNFIIEADAITKNKSSAPQNTLLKDIKSTFMEGNLNTNTQFYDFRQKLINITENFKKIPIKDIKSQMKILLIETNSWINIYSDYQDNLSFNQIESIAEQNEIIKETLKKNDIPLIKISSAKQKTPNQ